VIKRGFDIAAASLLLLLTLPIIVIAAIGSAISLRAWPFFVQDRVGQDGQIFRFVKVRTLPPETPAYADKYQLGDVKVPAFTLLLRRLHLDELPQLALVVAGKMSLVGPRPEMPGLHALLDPHFASARTFARPGCTGLWQVGHHCDGLIGESPEYDTFYIRHYGLKLDVWIMLQTARKVLEGGRTIALHDVPDWVIRPEPVSLPLPDFASGATIIELPSHAGRSPELAYQVAEG
jgi:lipopolysaccharide/colanic/teichoic acid biosynthesis glycosyltransferase